MCETCGCDAGDAARLTSVTPLDRPPHDHGDGHGHGHSHDHMRADPHDHTHPHERVVVLDHKVLSHNDGLAEHNRAWLAERAILALNVMSSPGSGKTTLLERTAADLSPSGPVAVIEGDQETVLDARRLAAAGARTVQVNTGSGCHLDAAMVSGALAELDPPDGSTVFIENVGNLVCPALFDLGERARVVLMSVTEGADKPLKYPHMFRGADVLLLNKVDLLPYVDFDVAACRAAARRLCPGLRVLSVSATRGDGLADWYDWLADQTKTA